VNVLKMAYAETPTETSLSVKYGIEGLKPENIGQ